MHNGVSMCEQWDWGTCFSLTFLGFGFYHSVPNLVQNWQPNMTDLSTTCRANQHFWTARVTGGHYWERATATDCLHWLGSYFKATSVPAHPRNQGLMHLVGVLQPNAVQCTTKQFWPLGRQAKCLLPRHPHSAFHNLLLVIFFSIPLAPGSGFL